MNATTPIRALFSKEEIHELTRRSDAAGLWAVGSTWAVILGTFAALARWPHPLVFALAVVVLGGRQLALAILMHEASHRSLFRQRALNDVLGNWLGAFPMWNDVEKYRKHHVRHHSYTGTERDPDLSLAAPFPTTRRSLARKLARDLTLVTGLKRTLGQLLMALEVIEYTVTPDVRRLPRNGRTTFDYLRAGLRNSYGFVLTNAALFAALALAGHAWVFSAWVVANLTTFNVFVRIRSIAEHACTEASEDPLRNTRTTRAGLLARATVAPIHVNYHREHHLLVSVPYFRLGAMHRKLRERGIVAAAPGYVDVLRIAGAGGA